MAFLKLAGLPKNPEVEELTAQPISSATAAWREFFRQNLGRSARNPQSTLKNQRSLVAKRFDWIKLGGLLRGPDAENKADPH